MGDKRKCYFKPGFWNQGGVRTKRGSILLYVTERREYSNAESGKLAKKELWVI